MMNENRDSLEIDLQKLLLAYLQKWWVIVISTVVCGVLALYFTIRFITPMYEASVMVYVNNTRGDIQLESITNTNLATAQRLVNTYINIIESDTVLEKVVQASGMDLDVDHVRGKMMSAKQVEDTEIFEVFITHADPVVAADLANAIAEVAPGEIERFVEGSSTKIIDYAKVPESPVSPSRSRNTVLGGLVGGVLAVLYITLRFLLDVRIKDEEDLSMLFELPVLAQIPAFISDGSRRGAYGNTKGYGYSTDTKEGGESK